MRQSAVKLWPKSYFQYCTTAIVLNAELLKAWIRS